MTLNENENIKNFVKSNLSFYETALLLSILNDYNFWNTKCRNIINSYSGKMKFKDFTKPIDNIIYSEISNFYNSIPETIINSGMSIKASKEVVLGMIANKCNESKYGFTANDILLAEIRFKDIDALKLDPLMVSENNGIASLVESGFPYWLELRRVHQISVYSIKNLDKIDAASVIDNIQSTVDQIGLHTGAIDDKSQTFGEALNNVLTNASDPNHQEDFGRIPIPGLPILTKALGGGLKRGETGLIIAGSGGGKTVIALQIASGVALMGLKTTVITTEQHSEVIVPRIISCNANIPFSKIKDGFSQQMLSVDEQERLREVAEPLSLNLSFENWCKTGEMLETHLETLIKEKKNKTGLDVLVIDWLGGAMGATAEQADKMHNYMMHCVNRIKTLALQYNIFILVLAQSNEKEEKKKMKLGRIDIDRCHTLDQPFTWALGISSLQSNGNQRVNSPQESYLRKQYINIWKGRMAGDLFYPILREFEFQRFVEKEIVELNTSSARQVLLDEPEL